MQMLLAEWPEQANLADFKGQTPLMLAANEGDAELVHLLLEAGADAYDVAQTYPAAMREMLGAIAARRPTSQPIEEGLRAVAVALAAITSAAST